MLVIIKVVSIKSNKINLNLINIDYCVEIKKGEINLAQQVFQKNIPQQVKTAMRK